MVVDKVTTLCGPGELVDVVVTERGIAVNPRRRDLIQKARKAGLPLKTIQELRDIAYSICGIPDPPVLDDEPVAIVKWVDGTVMDTVWKVKY